LATKAAEQQRSHLDYLQQLVEGEATMRENRSIERCIKNARPHFLACHEHAFTALGGVPSKIMGGRH
jgi:hypothetical protein